jgi:ATP-dependent 26S proteasome regulatory subunit
VFQRARAGAPSIVFLDEVDSIVGKRSDGSAHRGVQERVLSALLNEMDGVGVRLDEKTHATGGQGNILEGCDGLDQSGDGVSTKQEGDSHISHT